MSLTPAHDMSRRLQNCNDRPWTSSYPVALDSSHFAPGFAAPLGVRSAQSGQDLTPRAQRSIRLLSEELPEKMTLADVKACKLDTRCELADQFVDDLVAAAIAHGSDRAKKAAAVLASWDRRADAASVGTVMFLHWAMAVGATGQKIGGFVVPLDDRRPLETPRGFVEPARAVAALDEVAARMEEEYNTLEVTWGEVMRFPTDVRRLSSTGGGENLPGNGAPGSLGAIRTIGNAAFVDGTTEPIHGDTWFAVMEFAQTGVQAEALLGYGNWSKPGSKHVEDQMGLMSQNELRKVWRDRSEIEEHLERITVL